LIWHYETLRQFI